MVDSIQLEDTLNKHWKNTKKDGFGFRMLQKMGWNEDKGLGKKEDGMIEALKTKKRDEALGLGVQQDSAGLAGWNRSVSSFNDVLMLLNANYKTASSTSLDEKCELVDENATLAKKSEKTKIVGVKPKYKKFSSAKDLSSKSMQDMAAVLGFSPGFNNIAESTTLKRVREPIDSAKKVLENESEYVVGSGVDVDIESSSSHQELDLKKKRKKKNEVL